MPSPEHKEKIYQFVSKAIQFNKHHNIFQRTSAEEVLRKDVEESLQINPHISKQDTILDIGSGGGFPGVVIAISNPKTQTHLVESNQKKAYFLKQIKHDLLLDNLTVHNQRINIALNIFGFSLFILFGLVLFTLNYFIYQYSSFTLMIFTSVIVSILYIEMGIILSRNFFVKFFDDQLPKEIIYFIGFILMINAGYFTIMFILRIIKANTFI